jgi:Family of unknown function (DUF6308)
MATDRGLQIHIAGALVLDPIAQIESYLASSGTRRTLLRVDLRQDPHPDELRLADVPVHPTLASRISHIEADWFVSIGDRIDWSAVPRTATLLQADPATASGRELLSSAHRIYEHFWRSARDRASRPAGVRVGYAKIHKVLHVKRPNLIPILDRHLWRVYTPQSRDMALQWPDLVAGWRSLARWLAFGQDLVNGQVALQRSRQLLLATAAWRSLDLPDAELWRVSDVRLLDILVWGATRGT